MFLGFREHPRDESPLGEAATCCHAAVSMSKSASGPEEEKPSDHRTSCVRYDLRLSPVTDHMLQRGRKFEVSAKTLAREKQKANLN